MAKSEAYNLPLTFRLQHHHSQVLFIYSTLDFMDYIGILQYYGSHALPVLR